MDFIRRTITTLRSAFYGKAGLLRVSAIFAGVLFLTAAMPNAAEACGISDPLSCVAMIFVKIFQLLTALMGWILVLEVEALIRVAQYFNFVTPGPAAVQLGWVVTRDLANMFFIIILLIIAFGTILGSATYHYSKNLPRLLIMAVVINFSKTICGLFIDMGQVVMLTFVNGFKETAAGNFMNAYQINKLLALGNTDGSYSFGMVIAMMFAFILATIAVCVTLVLLVIVLFRVVMLWILIILSPLAFLASAIPSAEQYYKDWWRDFKKYIVTGPIIAFFMWLALASVQQAGTGGFASQGFPASYAGAGEAAAAANIRGGGSKPDSKIPTEAGTADTIMNMVIAISIMFAGLKYASESGVAGAGVARSVRGGLEKSARAIATGGLRAGLAPLKFAGGAAANRAKQGAWGVAGSLATRVPGLRGIGAAAKAREEDYKKKRQASVERFTGTEAQKAQFIPPKAYANRIAGMSDPKKQAEAFKLGLANPATAAAMFAKQKSKDGNEYTQAGVAMANVLKSGGDKDFLEMANLATTDKNVAAMMKDDPELVGEYQRRLSGIAGKDANKKKDLDNFNQKYVSQLATTQETWSDGRKVFMRNPDGSQMLDGKGQPIPKMILGDEDIKKMAPKIPLDDIPGMDARGLELLAPHMTDAQLVKARESAVNDPKKADALKSGLSGALASVRSEAKPDDRKIAAAALRSLSVGALKAEDIEGDVNLSGSIGRGMDASSYAKNVNRSDSDQMAAATAAFAAFKKYNPDKARGLAKHDQYQDFGMTNAAFAADAEAERAAVSADRQAEIAALASEAPQMSSELGDRMDALRMSIEQDTRRGMSAAGKQAELGRLESAMQQLTQSMNAQKGIQTELSHVSKEISDFKSQGGDINAPEFKSFERAAAGLGQQLNDLKSSIAKTVADVKGIKMIPEEKKGGNRGNRRT